MYMLVNFFQMRIYRSHPKFLTIFLEFGNSIPKYFKHNGGQYDRMDVVCCVDRSVDVEYICMKNGIVYHHLYDLEINEILYSSCHCVYHDEYRFTVV